MASGRCLYPPTHRPRPYQHPNRTPEHGRKHTNAAPTMLGGEFGPSWGVDMARSSSCARSTVIGLTSPVLLSTAAHSNSALVAYPFSEPIAHTSVVGLSRMSDGTTPRHHGVSDSCFLSRCLASSISGCRVWTNSTPSLSAANETLNFRSWSILLRNRTISILA